MPILLLLFQLKNSRHDELTNEELIYNWNESWLLHAKKNATIQIYMIELKVDHHIMPNKNPIEQNDSMKTL